MGEEGQKQARHCPWAQMCKQIGTTRGLVNTCWQRHASRGKLNFHKWGPAVFRKEGDSEIECWVMTRCLPRLGGVERVMYRQSFNKGWVAEPGGWGMADTSGRQKPRLWEVCAYERGEERGMLLDTRRGEKGVGATFKMFDLKEFRAPYKHRGANDNEL